MMFFFMVVYIVGILICGFAAWVTRKTEIYNVGHLTVAIISTLVPVFNLICGIALLVTSTEFFKKPINWD